MSRVPYASDIGSLMYAMLCTRPNLTQAISVVSRYMDNPGKEHWQTVKHMFKYLKGTIDIGLVYHGDTTFALASYLDFDYVVDLDARRFVFGYAFTIGNFLVTWKTTLQPIMALSTIKANLMALAKAAKEGI